MANQNQSQAKIIFTIFGATGDLAKKKLFPALYDLFLRNVLPLDFRIVAFSRRDWTDIDVRKYVQTILQSEKNINPEDSKAFVDHVYFSAGTFDDHDAYVGLATQLDAMRDEMGGCVHKLFYFATPPDFYGTIAGHLAASGATKNCTDETGWSRILIEKPFGKDAESAMELEDHLAKLFSPEQLFLIDHYLAKETIQNILLFRFANAMFEPLWSSKYIEKVTITLHESLGLEGRVTFYDGVGAFRDVGQSHLLQMLAHIAMEHPGELRSRAVRPAREAVLKALHLQPKKPTVRAQYKGYTQEQGIDADSQTETFFRVCAEVRNRRWKGTSFILESGKKLHERRARIRVYFKPATNPLCEGEQTCELRNTLTFDIQPDEGVKISFWTRKPGFSAIMEEQVLKFTYAEADPELKLPDAYEYVITKAMQGDQMLFPTPKEEQYAWEFTKDVLDAFAKTTLGTYEPGSPAQTIE